MIQNKNLIFGIRAVLEAIKSGKEIDKILIQRSLNNPLIKELHQTIKLFGVPFQYIPSEKLKQWDSKNHQGVVAFLSEITYYDIENVLPGIYENGDDPFILILDHITDVRNFGAITRTAECTGVHAVIIPDKGAASINADSIKASAGALLKIPICRSKSLLNTIKLLKDNGLQIVAASEKSESQYNSIAYNKPIAVVMGSEEKGISEPLLRISDSLISIPVFGTIESLNVSVAAGVILYEIIRQKKLSQ